MRTRSIVVALSVFFSALGGSPVAAHAAAPSCDPLGAPVYVWSMQAVTIDLNCTDPESEPVTISVAAGLYGSATVDSGSQRINYVADPGTEYGDVTEELALTLDTPSDDPVVHLVQVGVRSPLNCGSPAVLQIRPNQELELNSLCTSHYSMGMVQPTKTIVVSGTHGNATIDQWGSIRYAATGPDGANDSVRIRFANEAGAREIVYPIEIRSTANRVPGCTTMGMATATVRAGTTKTLRVSCLDPDGDPIDVSVNPDVPATGTVGAMTPVAGFPHAWDINYTAPMTVGNDIIPLLLDDGYVATPVEVSVPVTIIDAQFNTPPSCSTPMGLPLAANAGQPTNSISMPMCTDAEGDTLTYAISTQAAKGLAAVNASPSGYPYLAYTPNAGTSGSDSFTLRVSDGFPDSYDDVEYPINIAGASITCQPTPPISVRTGATRIVAPSCSETSWSSTRSAELIAPFHDAGTVTITQQGSMAFSVHALAVGTTSISVRVTSTSGATPATFTQQVTVADDANTNPNCTQPMSVGMNGIRVRENATTQVTFGCTDDDQDPIEVQVLSTTLGTASVTPPQPGNPAMWGLSITAGAAAGNGIVYLRATDDHQGVTNFSVPFTVIGDEVNSAPVCYTGMSFSTVYSGIGPQSLYLGSSTTRCQDAEGDAVTFALVSPPVQRDGEAAIRVANGTAYVDYTPTWGYAGTDSYTFKAVDSGGLASDNVTETISVVSQGLNCPAPDASVRTGTTLWYHDECGSNGTSFTRELVSVANPSIATAELDQGTVRITGVAAGDTTIRMRYVDQYRPTPLELDIAVHVAADVNHAPSCQAHGSVYLGMNRTLTVYCSDADNDDVTFAIDPNDAPVGTVDQITQPGPSELGGSTGSVRYSAASDAALGMDEFGILADDGRVADPVNASAYVSVFSAASNTAPACDSVSFDVANDATGFARSLDCADAQQDPVTVAITTQPEHGSATISYEHGWPVLNYDPIDTYVGADSVVLTPTDTPLGAVGAPFTVSLNVTAAPDTTSPDTTITSGPTGTTSSTTAVFAFMASETATFECKLDDGDFGPCLSPKTYTSLGAGSHTLFVRAIDAATNIDATPASRTWTVDTASTVLVSTQATAPAGGTVTTAAEPTASLPVATSIQTPNAGPVSVVQSSVATTAAPTGYAVFGQELVITAPAGTVQAPLRLTFEILASELPSGTDPTTVTVLRNGTAVTAACAGETADPTPCLRERTVLANGNVRLVVLTVQASTWVFGRTTAAPQPDGDGGTTTGGGTTTVGGTTGGGTTTQPEPLPPVVEPVPAKKTKLIAVSSRVVKAVCSKRDARNGVLVGKTRWCFKLVVTAKLVVAATGAPVAGQQVRFQRVVKPRPTTIGAPRSSVRGIAALTKPIIVPVKSRRTLKTATAWIIAMQPKVKMTHLLTGTTYAVAPALTVPTRG